jgi:hypothetical protein
MYHTGPLSLDVNRHNFGRFWAATANTTLRATLVAVERLAA